jgi:hypothetical protein
VPSETSKAKWEKPSATARSIEFVEDLREAILESVEIEPLTSTLAKIAGEALAVIRSATVVDAVVMASAASRGDIVYSSDVGDLDKLRRHFPGVRVLAV